MSDRTIILAYSGYFSGRLWRHLTRASEAKGDRNDLALGFIKGVFVSVGVSI